MARQYLLLQNDVFSDFIILIFCLWLVIELWLVPFLVTLDHSAVKLSKFTNVI